MTCFLPIYSVTLLSIIIPSTLELWSMHATVASKGTSSRAKKRNKPYTVPMNPAAFPVVARLSSPFYKIQRRAAMPLIELHYNGTPLLYRRVSYDTAPSVLTRPYGSGCSCCSTHHPRRQTQRRPSSEASRGSTPASSSRSSCGSEGSRPRRRTSTSEARLVPKTGSTGSRIEIVTKHDRTCLHLPPVFGESMTPLVTIPTNVLLTAEPIDVRVAIK